MSEKEAVHRRLALFRWFAVIYVAALTTLGVTATPYKTESIFVGILVAGMIVGMTYIRGLAVDGRISMHGVLLGYFLVTTGVIAATFVASILPGE